jgi:hypothetical protein
MASDPPARCDVCGGFHVPDTSAVVALLEQENAPVICLCDLCCGATVRLAAGILDQIALELAESVRARLSGQARMLRESGVVLRTVHVPRSARTELLGCVQAN